MAQMGVRTRRARATLDIEAAATSPARSPKRRKIINTNNTSPNLKFSPSSFLDQLNTISSGAPETVPETVPEAEDRCSSPTSDESPASCCSSNGFVRLHEESIVKLPDLEVHSSQFETSTSNCGHQIRREISLSSELGTNSQEVESTEKPTTQANSRCVLSAPRKMPTELELEEFFAAAEKDNQKRFSDKYNYDIVKDVPLEGRYEWVQLKP